MMLCPSWIKEGTFGGWWIITLYFAWYYAYKKTHPSFLAWMLLAGVIFIGDFGLTFAFCESSIETVLITATVKAGITLMGGIVFVRVLPLWLEELKKTGAKKQIYLILMWVCVVAIIAIALIYMISVAETFNQFW